MKTRIHLNSFSAISFTVVLVTKPASDYCGPSAIGESLAQNAPDDERRLFARFAGCALPNSLAEWFEDPRALELCGAATTVSTSVLEPELLNQRLARKRRCPSRRSRRARPFAREPLAVAGRKPS